MRSKRVLDVVGAVAGLVIGGLPMVVIAAAIRLTMGSPVLFRQARIGQGGREFEIVKFRTMRSGEGTDAERLTRLGGALRATSLDELPELWNVLRGDMSLVGPRPLLVRYLPRYSPRQARRHEVRPGLTGLAQVEGRNLLGWSQRLERDVVYVETRTMRLDLEILVRTLAAVVRRQGISGEGEATMAEFQGER